VIPYQACGLNKKRQISVEICRFLVQATGYWTGNAMHSNPTFPMVKSPLLLALLTGGFCIPVAKKKKAP